MADAPEEEPAAGPTPEEIREQARAKGHAEGYAEGLAQGRAEALRLVHAAHADHQGNLERILDQIHETAVAFREAEGIALTDIADQTAALAVDVAESILGHELSVSEDPGRDALVRALRFAPEEGDAQVRLHPDDVATLGDISDLSLHRRLNITADPQIERGGCVIVMESTRVDAQLSIALERVRKILR